MLTGDALKFYRIIVRGCNSFYQAMEILINWYNSDYKKSGVLPKWQSITLSEAMAQEPTESEVKVFRKFVAKLMTLQNQEDTTYHTYHFLGDSLLTAIYLP